jgi:hypothetical protein
VGQSARSARHTGVALEGHPDFRGHTESGGAAPESAAVGRAADTAAAAATSVRQRAPDHRVARVTTLTRQVRT